MAIIKALLAHPPQEDWTGRHFSFEVINYGNPNDCIQNGDYQLGGRYANWYYINANGYAQKYDPTKPPSKFPTPDRLIVQPTYEEPIWRAA